MDGSRSPGTVTNLMHLAVAGDAGARDHLYARVYPELKVIARHVYRQLRFRGPPEGTSLVNGALVKFLSKEMLALADRQELYECFRLAMRDELIAQMRRSSAKKRGGDWSRVGMFDLPSAQGILRVDAIDLYDALDELSEQYPKAAKAVEMRYLCSMTIQEVTVALGITEKMVRDQTEYGLSWLRLRLSPPSHDKELT